MMPRLVKSRKGQNSVANGSQKAKKKTQTVLLRLPSINKQVPLQELQKDKGQSTDSDDDSSGTSTPEATRILTKLPLVNTKKIKQAMRRKRRQSLINKFVHHMVIHSSEHQKIDGQEVGHPHSHGHGVDLTTSDSGEAEALARGDRVDVTTGLFPHLVEALRS